MARPQDAPLARALDGVAPQHFDDGTGKFETQKGSNGAIFTEDKKVKVALDSIKGSIDTLTEDDLLFIKKADAMPPVKVGALVYVIDTSEVYVPYKGKWELLV